MSSSQKPVIGRFAPSPTGDLHLGSLYTAVASFLHARSQGGQWLLRIDDLDTQRNVKGAASRILNTLESFGLHWDGRVLYQSQCLEQYQHALQQLSEKQQLYRCSCSRKDLANTPIYNGHCRKQSAMPTTDCALRIKTDAQLIGFNDGLQGVISRNLALQDGDFILKRKDGVMAYQFAVVIDDYQQGINEIVRGFDLLQETPKQLYLQQLLGLPKPDYLHVPIIVDGNGNKLSKQTRATAVDLSKPEQLMFQLLVLLQQHPPPALKNAPTTEQIAWAITHWRVENLKNIRQCKNSAAII